MILLEISENTPGARKAEEGIKKSIGERGGKRGWTLGASRCGKACVEQRAPERRVRTQRRGLIFSESEVIALPRGACVGCTGKGERGRQEKGPSSPFPSAKPIGWHLGLRESSRRRTQSWKTAELSSPTSGWRDKRLC